MWCVDGGCSTTLGSRRAHRTETVGLYGFCYMICDTCIIGGWLGLGRAYFPFPEIHDTQIRAVRCLRLVQSVYHCMTAAAAAAAASAGSRRRWAGAGRPRSWRRWVWRHACRRPRTNSWRGSGCRRRSDTADVWSLGIGATANSIGRSVPTADRRTIASAVDRMRFARAQW